MDGLPDGPVHFHYPAPDLANDLLALGRTRRAS
jgi:phospholipid/cholesterol/gamma-HCH transport system ATP-binding protein